nr:hypothetical protein L203_05591 [Cryptococcus depauperatus CBS 7841]
MSFTPNMRINRNLCPAGVSGSAGTGASINTSLLFSPNYHHDTDNAYSVPLAIARAGGKGGQIFVYSEDNIAPSGYSSFAGGGRRWGNGNAGEPSENRRESLTSYLQQYFSRSLSSDQPFHPHPHIPASSVNLATPPSSFTQSVSIPQAHPIASSNMRHMSLPLTPSSLPGISERQEPSVQSDSTSTSPNLDECNTAVTALISSIFPQHATTISLLSHTLEIITPPQLSLYGFIVDFPPPCTSGRTAFVYIPPGHSTVNQRPESLSPNFSQVLRPHDPTFLSSSPSNSSPLPSTTYALDIRESLTALLDLAAESLGAIQLVLVLDRERTEQEALAEMLHSLMYVGGQVVKSGGLEYGWEWNMTKWVLVGLEL